MAGIGFRIQKLLSGDSYTDFIKAYLYSSFVSLGPILVVMLTLGMIRATTTTQLSIEEMRLFMGLIIYVYAFSMIGVGPFFYVVTRYLADQYYLKEYNSFSPTYVSTLKMVFAFQAPIAILFLISCPIPLAAKWFAFCLYLFVNGIWIAMVFLSAAHSYLTIVFSYLIGGFCGLTLVFFLGKTRGLLGYVQGYTLGQGITFFILTYQIFKEFGFKRANDFGFILYLKKHPYLILIGLFYHLGLWVDKFIFWFTKGEKIAPHLFLFQDYDAPLFIAFLSTLPSMAYFLIQIETTFVDHYHAYFHSIQKRASLDELRARQNNIANNLSLNFKKFALFQSIITGLLIFFIIEIAEIFYLNPLQVGILRITLLGTFMQTGLVMIMNLLFYFDLQRKIFLISLLFFITNAVLTLITLAIGLPAYGFGYTLSCFVCFVFAYFTLDQHIRNLNFWTFMTQPILIPKFKFEAETSKS